MGEENYKKFRVVYILLISILTVLTILRGNYFLSVAGVLIAIFFTLFLRPKTGVIRGKQQINNQGKAAQTTMVVLAYVMGIGGFLLIYFARGNVSVTRNEFYYLESLGIILLYLDLFLIALHTIFSLLLSCGHRTCTIMGRMPMVVRVIMKKCAQVVIVGAGIFLLFFVISLSWIRYEVKNQCQQARSEYGGGCVDSLITLLNDEGKGFRTRNSAIWALGQFADARALPVLKRYYTGKIPPREPLDKSISQYELQKAIKWCTEGNITYWMYEDY